MCPREELRAPTGVFWTPPPTWSTRTRDSTVMPMSERKRTASTDRGDPFHVVHKVPAGDSPYVRAKHAQLILKDPNRAVSLFWAAINAGDRVDSALKDMAVVMKQLNRSDEGIEAIKSFRYLCPYDSQDSLDNLLLELYKKSGRIEEEAELLEHKLKDLEEGTAFGGRIAKTKRSQGKQIAVTIEQEKARILGNLAWVHLQLHNYGIAEQHYRKALSLEPDKNKLCNLAICLMRTDRIPEAKSLLQDVRDSLGSQWRDEPFSKSFERALEMFAEIESRNEHNNRRADNPDDGFLGSNCSDSWSRGSYSESFSAKSCFAKGMKENRAPGIDTEHGYAYKNSHVSPASVRRNSGGLFTQPRRSKWGYEDGDQRKGKLGGMSGSVRRLSFEKPLVSEHQNLNGEKPAASADEDPLKDKKLDQNLIHGLHEFITESEGCLKGTSKKSWADIVEEEEQERRGRSWD